MAVSRSYIRCLKKLGVTRKKTFTYSEKPEKEREVYVKQIAKIPEKSEYMSMNTA
jgi:hypothetical protein